MEVCLYQEEFIDFQRDQNPSDEAIFIQNIKSIPFILIYKYISLCASLINSLKMLQINRSPLIFIQLFFSLLYVMHYNCALMKKKMIKKDMEDEEYVIYTETNRRRKAAKKYIAAGSWTPKQNQIYLQFLQSHRELFQNQFVRRSTKVFRKMSSLLRRRDPQQCRSHHQKLVIKSNGTIDSIIERLKQKIQKIKQKVQASRLKMQEKNKQQQMTGCRNMMSGQQFSVTSSFPGSIQITIDLRCMKSW